MKTTIRKSVFETNSSSVHSMTLEEVRSAVVLVSKEEFEEFNKDELAFNFDEKRFYNREQLIKKFNTIVKKTNFQPKKHEFTRNEDTLRNVINAMKDEYWTYEGNSCYNFVNGLTLKCDIENGYYTTILAIEKLMIDDTEFQIIVFVNGD